MTKLELYNLALAHVSKPSLDSATGETESHIQCNAFYPLIRQLFITQSRVHLSRIETALALAAGESSERYTYVYDLPISSINPIEIWAGSETATKIPYVIESHSSLGSSVVKTDQESAVLIYSTDIENLNVYHATDIMAMSYLLAMNIVMPLRNDEKLQVALENKYIIALSVSVANDRNMQSVDFVKRESFNELIDARI